MYSLYILFGILQIACQNVLHSRVHCVKKLIVKRVDFVEKPFQFSKHVKATQFNIIFSTKCFCFNSFQVDIFVQFLLVIFYSDKLCQMDPCEMSVSTLCIENSMLNMYDIISVKVNS